MEPGRLPRHTRRVILAHDVSGAGPALLLLHSTATDARMWDAQRAALTSAWTVVTPDLRGFGRSPLSSSAQPEPYCHAADVVALLDHLGVDRTAVVASSGGGHVALQLASAHPGRVTDLVLLCAAAGGVEPTPDVSAFWAAEDTLLEAGDVAGAARLNADTWLGPDADAEAHELVRVMQQHAFEVQLAAGDVDEDDWDVEPGRITMPTTVVTGGHDLEWFGQVAAMLVRELPDARLVELAWAGHLPALERPEAVTALIADALVRPAGGAPTG